MHVGCADHVVRTNSRYWLHDHVYKSFPYVVGLDISNDNICKMQASGYEKLFVGNAEDFELHEKFDTILAGELIEHLSNPGLFMQQAKKHLQPGGRLVISTPTPFSLLNILYAWMKYPKTCQNQEHSMWFCVSTIRSLAGRYGFVEQEMKMIRDYELDDPSLKYRIFAYIMTYFGFIIPRSLKCNNMLFVFVQP